MQVWASSTIRRGRQWARGAGRLQVAAGSGLWLAEEHALSKLVRASTCAGTFLLQGIIAPSQCSICCFCLHLYPYFDGQPGV